MTRSPFDPNSPVGFFILLAIEVMTALTHAQIFSTVLTFFAGIYFYASVTAVDMTLTFNNIAGYLKKAQLDQRISLPFAEIIKMHTGIKR